MDRDKTSVGPGGNGVCGQKTEHTAMPTKAKSQSQTIKRLLLLLTLLLLIRIESAAAVDVCLTGMFKYTPKEGPDICVFCYPGSFMPHHLHTERMCYDCTQIQNPDLEILVSPCDIFQDTEIHCIDGYFRTKPTYPDITARCQKCTECLFVKGGCHDYDDTVCCPGEDYDIRVNKEGTFECVRLCGLGQSLDLDNNQCLPCPANTFINEKRHTVQKCWTCNEPTSENEVVIQPCTSTHPALIGCKEGYYQRSTQAYPFHGCAKCHVCSENTSGHIYEARSCDMYSDTVCCSELDMVVVDTSEGPQCQHPHTTAALTTDALMTSSRRCGRGKYLVITGPASSCLPCPVGTCMSETDHSRTSCSPCADLEGTISSEPTAMTSTCRYLHNSFSDSFAILFLAFAVIYQRSFC